MAFRAIDPERYSGGDLAEFEFEMGQRVHIKGAPHLAGVITRQRHIFSSGGFSAKLLKLYAVRWDNGNVTDGIQESVLVSAKSEQKKE